MRKGFWSNPLLRIMGISLLIIIVVFWVFKHNPQAIVKFRRMIFSSKAVSPQRWILESRKLHTICGHIEIKRAEYQKEEPFMAIIENYSKQVKKVNNQSYRFLENSHDLCESCRNNQYLGIDGRQIAVFRGTPINPGPVMEKMEIDLNKLPIEEIEDLKKGIPFRDGKEKLQLLEGLNGLTTE